MKETKIFVPELPESINNAIILKWYKNIGEILKEDEIVAEIETDKIILEVSSPTSGILKSQYYTIGQKVKTNDILGIVKNINHVQKKYDIHKKNIINKKKYSNNHLNKKNKNLLHDFTPKIRRMILNNNINIKDYKKNNIDINIMNNFVKKNKKKIDKNKNSRKINRIPMSLIRKKISERLLFTIHNTAMLTTFNEVNMQSIIKIRKKYKNMFFEKYNINLGYMSFFVKAVTEALKFFPEINASIDNDDIIYYDYYDINIAISTNRGLITPLLKDTNLMNLFQIEKKIKYFSDSSKNKKISLDDLTSGNFTITNGGVFGSLMSTPIINPPQVAILGMHNIKKRPIVGKNNTIEIAPMMYLALSYDHRLIDGKLAITFLNYIKDILEDISRILLNI